VVFVEGRSLGGVSPYNHLIYVNNMKVLCVSLNPMCNIYRGIFLMHNASCSYGKVSDQTRPPLSILTYCLKWLSLNPICDLRFVFNFLFPVCYSKGQSACAFQNFIQTLLFCQRILRWKLKVSRCYRSQSITLMPVMFFFLVNSRVLKSKMMLFCTYSPVLYP